MAFETILKKHDVQVDIAAFVATYVPINSKYWKLYQDDEVTQEQLRYGRLKMF
jgi:putative hydrolase of the HAD superfamily